MTIKDVIQNSPGVVDVSVTFLEKILIDRSVNGAIDYDSSHSGNVELCLADLYYWQLVNPDFSEGKLSIKYDKVAMLNFCTMIYQKNGETDKLTELLKRFQGPTLTSVSW